MATNTNCPCGAGRATAIQAALPRKLPISGTHRLHDGDAQRDDESEVTELGNHGVTARQ